MGTASVSPPTATGQRRPFKSLLQLEPHPHPEQCRSALLDDVTQVVEGRQQRLHLRLQVQACTQEHTAWWGGCTSQCCVWRLRCAAALGWRSHTPLREVQLMLQTKHNLAKDQLPDPRDAWLVLA